jgi:hypothetical protein
MCNNILRDIKNQWVRELLKLELRWRRYELYKISNLFEHLQMIM